MNWLNKYILSFGGVALIMGSWQGCMDYMGYRINFTNSLPRGLYQQTDGLIHYGTVVAECLPEQWAILAKERGWVESGSCPTDTPPISKQVVAMAGNRVKLTDEYVAVDGLIIPRSATQKEDSQGRMMPIFPRGEYLLQTGELWLMATNIDKSLDSRYLGKTHVADLIATARAVWTWGRND